MYLHCPTCRLTVHRERALTAGETPLCPRCSESGVRVALQSTPARFFRPAGSSSTATRPLGSATPARAPAHR